MVGKENKKKYKRKRCKRTKRRKTKRVKRSKNNKVQKKMKGGVLPVTKYVIQDEGTVNEDYIILDLPLTSISYTNKAFWGYGFKKFSFIITKDKDKIYIIKDRGSGDDRPWIGHSSVLSSEERSKYTTKQVERKTKEESGDYETNNPEDYVYLAGVVYYDGEKIFKISNWSGHYSMPYVDFLSAVTAISDKLPGIEFVNYLVEEREKLEEAVDTKIAHRSEGVQASRSLLDEKSFDELTEEEYQQLMSAMW